MADREVEAAEAERGGVRIAFMRQKRVFQWSLAALAIMMALLPFTVSLNDFLTRFVQGVGWYRWIQAKIVPVEVGLVGVVVGGLGVNFVAYPEGFTANGIYGELSWNCLGWQSLFLFLVSLPIGLGAGSYTWFSRTITVLVGLLGTFLVNLARISFTVLLLVVSKPLFALVFHDYLAAVMTIVWLVGFWWLAYAFLLEEKPGRAKERQPKTLRQLREEEK